MLNCTIVVSLDSVVKTTYERIRVNANFEQTLKHFEALCDFNKRQRAEMWIAVCPMVSNAIEIPGLVDFATDHGVRVLFNTVVFHADHSLKALGLERQREILALYRSNQREPRNAIGSWNWAPLDGFCRQIELWMGDQEAADAEWTPWMRRCAELLAAGSTTSAQRVLLPDLLRERSHSQDSSLVPVEEGNPVELLKAYFQGAGRLGVLLEGEGLLPDTHFDLGEELVFLRHLSENIGLDHARRIYTEIRRFPKLILSFVGTTPAPKLIELIESHLAARD